jgi:hypothetical protein
MSGSFEKPDIRPTFPAKNPTFGVEGPETHPGFSQYSQYSELPEPCLWPLYLTGRMMLLASRERLRKTTTI